jgi:alanyl-tRNA synthetase
MAQRLYLQDPYLMTFTAQVVERVLLPGGRLAVTLDRTAFRPQDSGVHRMLADRGWLNRASVIEVQVREEDGELLHVLSDEIWENQVQARVDAPRRLDLMRQHTAGHLIADVLSQLCGVSLAGITVGEQEAFLEVEPGHLPAEKIEQAETLVNETVLGNRAVRAATVTAAQAAKVGLVALSPEGYLLPGAAPVQVVSIEGAQPVTCDTVHVAHTGEIGLIKVIGAEERGERLRLRFVSGARALSEFRRLDQALSQLAASLGASPANVVESLTRLLAELASTRKELQTVRGTVADFEADALTANTETVKDVHVVRRVYAARDLAELRQLARTITMHRGYVAMLGTAGNKAQLVFERASDVRHDMRAPIRIAAQVLNTQGGGQAVHAESVPVRADEARVEAAIAKAFKWLQAQP